MLAWCLNTLPYKLLKRKNKLKSLQNSLESRERYQHPITLLYHSRIFLVTIEILKPDIDGFDTFHISLRFEGKIRKNLLS